MPEMMMTRFTVFIPNYNYADYISEAIDSVLNQTIYDQKSVEIIIIDDGSSDESPLIVSRYKQKVKYIFKKNGGLSSSWNIAIGLAKGEYFCALDADDIWMPEKLEELEKAAIYKPAVIYHKRSILGRERASFDFPIISGDLIGNRNLRRQFRGTGGTPIVFRRDVLNRIGPIPDRLRTMSDGFYQFTAPFYGKVIGIDRCLSSYRLHPGSVFSSQKRETIEKRARILIDVLANYYESHGYERRIYRDFLDVLEFEMIKGGRSRSAFPLCITENLNLLKDFERHKNLAYKFWKLTSCFCNKKTAAVFRRFRREVLQALSVSVKKPK